MNTRNTESGLPDISELKSFRMVLFIIIALITIGTLSIISHFNKPDKKPKQAKEENYTVQITAPEVSKKTDAVAQPAQHLISSQPTVDPEVMKQRIALIEEKQKELQQRLMAPLMLVNNNNNQANNVANNSSNDTNVASHNTNFSRDRNTQFMTQVSAQTTDSVNAVSIGPLNTLIAEGTFIHATLEPAVNSDLPGHLRASVSSPVYSEIGTQVLVPPGSRLLGQYKSGLLQGQSRVFVVWTRLITPDGLSVQLGSSGVDSLGVAGIAADETDRHFWERFGTASLLSLIGAGTANVGVQAQDQNNAASQYREAIAASFAQSADQSLQQDGRMPPTLKIYQGKDIMVFVAKDLHFNNALQQTQRRIEIF